MILFKVTKYLFLDAALDALYKNILRNFPFLIRRDIKVGSKMEKIVIIFDLGAAGGDQKIMAEMCDVEVMSIDGDMAVFSYKLLKVNRDNAPPFILSKEDTMEIPISSLLYR